mgnify:FL=1
MGEYADLDTLEMYDEETDRQRNEEDCDAELEKNDDVIAEIMARIPPEDPRAEVAMEVVRLRKENVELRKLISELREGL